MAKKSKLLHLSEKCIEIITINAVIKKKDFKNLAQDILEREAVRLEKSINQNST